MTFPKLTINETSVHSYCDFIEYCCFINKEISISDLEIHDENISKDIVDELNRRLGNYIPFQPFHIKKDKVISELIQKEKFLHYFFCLYYSLKGGTSDRLATNIFEKISDKCLKNYFCTSKSIITSIGQSQLYLKNSILSTCENLREIIGNDINIPNKAKDGGIDIITYMPIDDRGNQLICLTDATIGKNWFTSKMVKTQLESWTEYIHFKVTPLTCLAILHIIEPEIFHHASKKNGLLFDRTRIMKYYSSDESISLDMNTWFNTLC